MSIKVKGRRTYSFLGDILWREALLSWSEGIHGVVFVASVAKGIFPDEGVVIQSLHFKFHIFGEVFVSEDYVFRVQLLVRVESLQVGINLKGLAIVRESGLRGTLLKLVIGVVNLEGTISSHMLGTTVVKFIVVGRYPIECPRIALLCSLVLYWPESLGRFQPT